MKVEIINRKKLLAMIKDDWVNEKYHAVISFSGKMKSRLISATARQLF